MELNSGSTLKTKSVHGLRFEPKHPFDDQVFQKTWKRNSQHRWVFTSGSTLAESVTTSYEKREKTRIECHPVIPSTNSLNVHFQPVVKVIIWVTGVLRRTVVGDRLDSENGFRTDCRNISRQQQSFSGLQSPRWSFSIKVCYSWVRAIFLLSSKSVKWYT